MRIIAATHQNLLQRIAEGAFRENLYYRLETFTLEIPSLRERGDDMIRLAHSLLSTFVQAFWSEEIPPQSADSGLFEGLSLPGNVRELQNVMARAMAFAESGVIHCQHMPERVQSAYS